MFVHLKLADNLISAHRDSNPNFPGKWIVEIRDTLTGNGANRTWSDGELAAVTALAIGLGEENPDSDLTKSLYAIAEPLMAGFPNEVRPIP